jgi:hypothetical protein
MLQQVREAAADGRLVPLRLATGSFGVQDERVGLLYAESVSAVTFLYEKWGDEGVAQLLEAFHQGADLDEALLEVTGLDFEGFQQAWWVWLGGAPGAYPAPPPWPPLTPAGATVTATEASPSAAPTGTEPPSKSASRRFPCLPAGAIVLAAGSVAAARRRR